MSVAGECLLLQYMQVCRLFGRENGSKWIRNVRTIFFSLRAILRFGMAWWLLVYRLVSLSEYVPFGGILCSPSGAVGIYCTRLTRTALTLITCIRPCQTHRFLSLFTASVTSHCSPFVKFSVSIKSNVRFMHSCNQMNTAESTTLYSHVQDLKDRTCSTRLQSPIYKAGRRRENLLASSLPRSRTRSPCEITCVWWGHSLPGISWWCHLQQMYK